MRYNNEVTTQVNPVSLNQIIREIRQTQPQNIEMILENQTNVNSNHEQGEDERMANENRVEEIEEA